MKTQLTDLLDLADAYRAPDAEQLTAFLRGAADQILALGDDLVEVCHRETALPVDRLMGERARTTNQLRLFADLVQDGSWIDARIDRAQPDRKPLPKPDLRRMLVPLGPVGVFSASNFPFAFSVAGGDSASAWAAGCPVVVKPHPGHPATSQLVAQAIHEARRATHTPEGVFGMLDDTSVEAGLALVREPRLKAVGFTGSTTAGMALLAAASARPDPIPVFAEMSSVNPLFVLPAALQARGSSIAAGLAKSVTLGVGQFCTKPGLVLISGDAHGGMFRRALTEQLCQISPSQMLTEGIRQRFEHRLAETRAVLKSDDQGPLLTTDSATFRREPGLREEIFGPTTLLVVCRDAEDLLDVARTLGGQLTATVHADPADMALGRALLPILTERAGRVVWNGYPTGVEVCPSMQHGGPFPATSDSRFTSVGTAAIQRFARPVCHQDLPEALLPEPLRNANERHLWRLVDGQLSRDDA